MTTSILYLFEVLLIFIVFLLYLAECLCSEIGLLYFYFDTKESISRFFLEAEFNYDLLFSPFIFL
jgi:hypothetical protein